MVELREDTGTSSNTSVVATDLWDVLSQMLKNMTVKAVQVKLISDT